MLNYFYNFYFYFIDTADKMVAAILPFDLGELDMVKFQDRYDEFQKACWGLGAALILFIAFLDVQATKDDEKPNQVTDDIFDSWISFVVSEIQIMSHLCIDDRLQTLKEEYAGRIEKLILHNIFSQYANDHTGIEHKAGVPKGGTFILVYAKGDVIKNPRSNKETFIELDSKKTDRIGVAETERVNPKDEKDAEKAGPLAEKAAAKMNEKQRKLFALKQQILRVKQDEAEVLSKEETETLVQIEKTLGSEAFVGERFDIPDAVVFADFYLPYLCCSDCAPVTYVLQENKPDPVQPTIDILPKEFCNQDNKGYAINTTPGGGTLGKAAGVDVVNFKFSPLGLPQGTVTITYTKDGLSTNVICQVFAPKSAEFVLSSSVDAAGVFTVTITPADTGGSHEWFLDDAATPFSNKPTPDALTFTPQGANQTIKIAHTIKNGPCTSEPVFDSIVLQKGVSNITDPPISACFAQNIPMAVLSAGSVLSVSDNGGLQINAQGFIVFGGPLATAQLSTTVKYTITTVSAIVNHTVLVTLFKNFVADFELSQKELPDRTVELTCTATDAAAKGHKWAVDGVVVAGATTAVFKQIFNFQEPEKIVKIRHFVKNGQCQAEDEIPVVLKHGIINDNIKAFACAGIKSEQVIDASLVEGDTIQPVNVETRKIRISQKGNTVVAVINPAAFPAMAVITVVYRITKNNGQVINRTADIQVGVVDTQFRITANPATKTFIMNALGAKVLMAEWEFIEVSTGAVKFKQTGDPVQMPIGVNNNEKGRINLRITQQFGTDKEDVCKDQISVEVDGSDFRKITQTPGGVVFP